jgi:hypothetical protein
LVTTVNKRQREALRKERAAEKATRRDARRDRRNGIEPPPGAPTDPSDPADPTVETGAEPGEVTATEAKPEEAAAVKPPAAPKRDD